MKPSELATLLNVSQGQISRLLHAQTIGTNVTVPRYQLDTWMREMREAELYLRGFLRDATPPSRVDYRAEHKAQWPDLYCPMDGCMHRVRYDGRPYVPCPVHMRDPDAQCSGCGNPRNNACGGKCDACKAD